MNRFLHRATAAARILPFGLVFLVGVTLADARAQDGNNSSAGFLDRVFGRPSSPAGAEPGSQVAQLSASDLMMRLDRLEGQIRQLTGAIEQLQFRNQQLEQQLRRSQEDNEFRFQELGSKSGARAAPPRRSEIPARDRPAAVPGPQRAAPVPAPVAPSGRGDAFDPSANPNAPGVPRVLGSNQPIVPDSSRDDRPGAGPPDNDEPIGAPGGRAAGAPLDLSTLAGRAVNDPSLAPSGGIPSSSGSLPPPPPRNPNATGGRTAMVAPPSQNPKDAYDLAYGYMLHKDYALAEEAFRAFLQQYPGSNRTADVNYWLGEALFQRERYRDAAEFFLTVTEKFDTSPKAPESLLRLGQSLAALGERETACAAIAEIARKYPRASLTVKKGVTQEMRRARC
jgi:tol-pal system protein YbgF